MGETREHLPSVPGYWCGTCHDNWPCPPARTALLAEFAALPTLLFAYMCGHLDAAWGSSLGLDGDQLGDRFLAWIPVGRLRPAAAPAGPAGG
jgi:hypothetical protein